MANETVKWCLTDRRRRWLDSLALLMVAVVLGGGSNSHAVSAVGPVPAESFLWSSEVSDVAPTQEIDSSYFLPNSSVPTHYAISLRTDIHEDVRTFSATTRVHLTVREPTDRITMHAQELTVGTVILYRVPTTGGSPVKIDEPTAKIDIVKEHIIFLSTGTLPAGDYILEVSYTGSMRNYQSGYLVSRYRDDAGQWRSVGTTHFQATLARRVFPCYDEPALKATFELEITNHRTYTAIANMPRASIEIDPTNREYLTSRFEKSPLMSTYLLAFAVTDFVTLRNGSHEVVVRSNAQEDAKYAVDVGATILERLGSYLELSYYDQMPKMTSIAVPDRGTGAMENWGLVTYGEPSLLYNPAVNTYRNRKRVTTVIAHEYAHQWFGDLVSPRWWDYIWLNEGFATLYEYYATRLAEPGDEYWELFNGEVIQRAFLQDASENIRPMNWNAATPDEVSSLFDIIAYQKAGSVLNMFRNVLGETGWREGLIQYLTERGYDAATEENLAHHLQRAVEDKDILPAAANVRDLLASWTDAPGFPVLNVHRLYRNGAMILSQERFLEQSVLPTGHVWHIPYNYAHESAATFYDLATTGWLGSRAAKIETPVPDDEWVVFNKQQTGYYRVNYDRRNWALLTEALLANHYAIHRLNRAQLIDDAFNLARADLLDMAVVLKLMRYLRAERDYAPWFAADKVLTYLYDKLRATEHEHSFLVYVDGLISEVYASVSVDTVNQAETTLYKYLRQLVTAWACRIGYSDCLTRSRDALRKEHSPAAEETAVPVHPDVRAVVYCYGLQEDAGSEFQAIFQRLMASRNQAERTDLIDALGCSRNADSIRTLLATIVFSAAPGSNFVYLSDERNQMFQAIVSGGRPSTLALMDVLADTVTLQQIMAIVGEGTISNAVMNIARRTNGAEEMARFEALLTALQQSLPPVSRPDEMMFAIGKNLSLLLLVVSSATLSVLGQRPAVAHPEWSDREFALPVEDAFGPRDDLIDQSYRLPTDTVPTHYTIQLYTDLHTGSRTFLGLVQVHFDVVVPTNAITLHSRGLTIASAALFTREDDGLLVEFGFPHYELDARTEQLTFHPGRVLPIGSYVLTIDYSGLLETSSNSGFFLKSYVNDAGERRYVGTTQFESTNARMAFPCYDEPLLKASYTLWIMHSADYNAVSNMPVEEVVPSAEREGFVTTKFGPTPKMSSYLLAFGVSDFVGIEDGQQQVYARPNAIHEAKFALEAGVKVLDALNAYTDVSYYDYMPKLSQMAIPDRGSGAMENWGLVKYGEPALLFNPERNTYRTRKGIAVVIAHEYAHQWFGNLVGPHWWSYIWLNEGFANLFGYIGADLAYPSERYWDLYAVENVQNAFGPDASDSIRPMTQDATTPSAISGLFDSIAYDKSGSVLNMFRTVLGDDNFRAGLKLYFQDRQLDGAVADDLYAGLQAAIDGTDVLPEGFTVKQLMDSWTTEPGYPVLTVRRNYDEGSVILSQERFYANKREPNAHLWYIPYSYASASKPTFDDLDHFRWLSTPAERVKTSVEADEWLVFNKQQTGYYRVNYDAQNWALIAKALRKDPSAIHRFNRAQLINDAFNLARADRHDMAQALDLLRYLSDEREYVPWAAANGVLNYFYNKLRGTASYHDFIVYVDALLGPVFESLGDISTVPEDEALLDKYLKQLISTWACRVGYTECLRQTTEALHTAVETNTPVHPDVSYVVYCYGLKGATDDEYRWLFNQMISSRNEAERAVLIDALGCAQDQSQLVSLLTVAIGSNSELDSLLPSERSRIVSSLYSAGRYGVEALIAALSDPLVTQEFVNRLGQGTLNSVVSNVASRTNNAGELEQLKQFLAALGDLVSTETADAAVRTVKTNEAWFETYEGLLSTTWVNDNMSISEIILVQVKRELQFGDKMVTTRALLVSMAVCLLASQAIAGRPAWKWLVEPSDLTLAFEQEQEQSAPFAPSRRQAVDETYRLPNSTAPVQYHLSLRTAIHENNRQFSGTVLILFEVLEATTTVTLHNRQLSVQRAFLHEVAATGGGAGAELEQAEHATDTRTEHLTLTLQQMLAAGTRYYLRIEFQGTLQNNNNMGFFASSYLDNNGVRHYLASSKFEPTHARSAFPCYDEPLLKASFELELTHHKDYNAVANMPQAGAPVPDPDNADYVTSRFELSTKMPTYLVAFAVSDFSIRTAGRQTVYARPNVYDETAYPLEAGNQILDALSAYMDVSYYDYMPKMTQIAIPDRGTGAMENWGLVAYGEPVLLFNPAINTYRNKKSVTTIIAHEYAHQWFGNLVSPHWWEFIWLNEGFATVYEYYAAQLAYPEGEYWEFFTVEVIQNAFGADASETVRPMNWNAGSPNEIAGLFDTVAYDKSGSVLNMFRVALGDNNWRAGLKRYMSARQLDGATAEHLYAGLQEALAANAPTLLPAGVTVRQLMDSWTSEPGFPIVNVYRTYGEAQEVIVSQERFLSNRQLPNSHVFHIPYDFTGGNAPDFEPEPTAYRWLSTKADKIATSVPKEDWIIFNRQQNGYYRVNYDAHNWDLLIEALHNDPTRIHRRNRAQLVNDAYNLARAERLDLSVALRLMGYLRKETEYAPWTAAGSALTYFNNKLRGTEHYAHFQTYVNRILLDIYPTLAVDSVANEETLLHRYLKQFITTWACRIGHGDCLARTKQALAAAHQTAIPVHPDIVTAVYCNGLVDASDETFVWVFEQFKNSRNQAHRTVLIDALACARKPSHLESLLSVALGGGSEFDSMLSSERTRIVSAVYGASREGVDAVIDFLMVPLWAGELVRQLGQSTLNSAISNIASRTNNAQELARLEALLTYLGSTVPESVATSARNTVQNNFNWFNSLEGLVAVEHFTKAATTPQEL
uniref:Aminopeptidase N n=1 Tax=Anopheles dirus TaxID=7168 RepID=A0A182N5W6_9DIPT